MALKHAVNKMEGITDDATGQANTFSSVSVECLHYLLMGITVHPPSLTVCLCQALSGIGEAMEKEMEQAAAAMRSRGVDDDFDAMPSLGAMGAKVTPSIPYCVNLQCTV